VEMFVFLAVLLAQAVVPSSDEAPLVPLGDIAGCRGGGRNSIRLVESYLMIQLRVGMLAMRAMLFAWS